MSDVQAIRSFYDAWFAAMEAGDLDRTLSLLAKKFTIKAPGQPAIHDREEMRAGLEAFHRQFAEKVEWRLEQVRIAEGWAVAQVSEETTLRDRENAETTLLKGTHLAVLERDPGGDWLLQTDVSSFDHPQ